MLPKHVISSLDLSKEEIELIFDEADRYEKLNRTSKELEGKVVALAFFEPSTRTRNSFDSAVQRMGGRTIGFSSSEGTSVEKGETIADTVRMLESYSDLIVMRHKLDGAAKFASEISKVPIINAGDGKHEHPTQALIDLYTVRKVKGYIDGLNFCVLGDLKYGRAVNSLLRLLTKFKPGKVFLVSPQQLRIRTEVKDTLNFPVIETDSLQDVIDMTDVLYVTRIQKERFADEIEFEKVKESYKVDISTVNSMRKDSMILHPLPRVNEIDRRVDKLPQAKYFYQASLGVQVRMGVIHQVIGDSR
ncbi:aspartate carbamoyltransferase [Sulfuracidifex metallicus]|uniref:Aspartate carbamoyltransferase n=1 Tax=Sulfuracidifex metallicus DSM 6482 = JCM 9184 TaxID=523847 RepID=A0A6A9QIW5_SULME|nr:aspartate carbamoyltransferase [Sulfuracidifex metallicus]MUN28160.1 aspartate carbamoyltransferase [Sulfuracidifex metallicus DSM 6482 = JCM 9184]WOE51305.1 aspartate carbamoyltransferase [Sulfuracidifex metallicus DSM 6482 = JCM 9184]